MKLEESMDLDNYIAEHAEETTAPPVIASLFEPPSPRLPSGDEVMESHTETESDAPSATLLTHPFSGATTPPPAGISSPPKTSPNRLVSSPAPTPISNSPLTTPKIRRPSVPQVISPALFQASPTLFLTPTTPTNSEPPADLGYTLDRPPPEHNIVHQPPMQSEYAASLFPLPTLPVEVSRKKRKRDKGTTGSSGASITTVDLARWEATLLVNPVTKYLRQATKCVTTAEWMASP